MKAKDGSARLPFFELLTICSLCAMYVCDSYYKIY
jgi:hypothetical protein